MRPVTRTQDPTVVDVSPLRRDESERFGGGGVRKRIRESSPRFSVFTKGDLTGVIHR